MLATKRGKFGAFVGCSRYPDCKYIQRDGPPPPDQLPFEVTCPKNSDGHLVPRRARRTGNVFWGCSNYPRCDFTTNFEPVGATHDAHEDGHGAVARHGETGICLACGADVPLPDGALAGLRLPGGAANPAALAKPARRGGGGGGRRAPARGAGTAARKSPRAAGTGPGRSAANRRMTRAATA